LRNNRKNESFSTAWESAPSSSAWATTTETTRAEEPVAVAAAAAATYSSSDYVKYKAVYEFYGRNNDEITFQPGDIIMVMISINFFIQLVLDLRDFSPLQVPVNQNAEPGWLAGEINGHTGWFPETYAEKCEDGEDGDGMTEISEAQSK
jgi:hypothetical protein